MAQLNWCIHGLQWVTYVALDDNNIKHRSKKKDYKNKWLDGKLQFNISLNSFHNPKKVAKFQNVTNINVNYENEFPKISKCWCFHIYWVREMRVCLTASNSTFSEETFTQHHCI